MDTRRGADPRPQATGEEIQPDQAVFTVASLQRPKRSVPVGVVVALAIGIVAVAIVGALGRQPPAPIAAEVPRPPVVTAPPVRSTSERLAEGPFGPLDGRTGVRPGRAVGPLLTVGAERDGQLLFVHGDVFTRQAVAVQVLVTVADGRNRTLVMQSVDLPGGSTAFRLAPNDRYDLAVELPDAPSMQATTISASALDGVGSVIATARTELGALGTEPFVIEAPVSYR